MINQCQQYIADTSGEASGSDRHPDEMVSKSVSSSFQGKTFYCTPPSILKEGNFLMGLE